MATDQRARSGVRIYRAADAPDLGSSDFNRGSDFGDDTRLQDVVSTLAVAADARTGSRLLVRQTPNEGGFSLVYLFFKPNFPLFRHKHESDCLYVVLSGSAVMGSQTLGAGDCFFVPAYAPYAYTAGPDGVEVLEIRHNADGFTTIFANDQATRLDEAEATVEANAASWKAITSGPLLRANRAQAVGSSHTDTTEES